MFYLFSNLNSFGFFLILSLISINLTQLRLIIFWYFCFEEKVHLWLRRLKEEDGYQSSGDRQKVLIQLVCLQYAILVCGK